MRTSDSRRPRRTWLAQTALCALAGLTVPTLAKAEGGDSGANAVEEVVVTAQKRTEDIQKVPISIQTFTAEAITDLGLKNSSDIGQFTPNVDIALPGGAGSEPILSIRGIALNDYDTNNAGPNGVYIDEVYISAPGSQNFQIYDLDRIEVLKGPQGTLYGRNTSGGAINYITNKPTDQFGGNLHVEYSSYNTEQVEGAINGPISSNLDARLAFVQNYSQGYFHNDLTGGPENGANDWAARGQLLWKPTSDLKFLFNIHGGQVNNRVQEYRHIGDFAPGTQGSASPTQCSVQATNAGQCVDLYGYGTPAGFYEGAYNRNEHLKVNNVGASVRADWSPDSAVTVTSITAFEHNDKFHPEDSDASPYRMVEADYGVLSNTITQEFRAAGSVRRLNWVGGLYYLYENLNQNQPLYLFQDFDEFGGFGVPAGPGAGDGIAQIAYDRSQQISRAYAAFGQGDYAITSKLKLTLGGRYTAEQRSFRYQGSVQYQAGGENNYGPIMPTANDSNHLSDSAFNWRAALDYAVTSDILVYGSAATGFKSGDFNGSFLSLNLAEVALQLQPVKPEHVTAFEAGFKTGFFERRVLFDGAAFYNDYDNLQVFELVNPVLGGTGSPVSVLDNAKKAHTEGVEVQAQIIPLPHLTASAQIGYLETRFDQFLTSKSLVQQDYTGNQLPLSPHWSFAGVLDYRIPVDGGSIDAQLSATFKSHQFFDDSNDPYTTQDGYWIENIRVAYKIDKANVEIAGYVRNLAGTQYYLDKFDLTSPFGFIQGIVGQPRSYGVEVNYHF
jgi:iron complex outermembrane receptor protein